jgi:hypothetical protein
MPIGCALNFYANAPSNKKNGRGKTPAMKTTRK